MKAGHIALEGACCAWRDIAQFRISPGRPRRVRLRTSPSGGTAQILAGPFQSLAIGSENVHEDIEDALICGLVVHVFSYVSDGIEPAPTECSRVRGLDHSVRSRIEKLRRVDGLRPDFEKRPPAASVRRPTEGYSRRPKKIG
jgi:hypothetical protein